MERVTGLDLERNLLAWKEGSTKTIVSSQGVVEAYDLAADPEELAPLALTAEDVARALERARAWWQAWPVDLDGAGELDDEALERLRDLGYLGE
jgi:citrate lyase beta subunit